MADILALQELDTDPGTVVDPGEGNSSQSGVCSAASYVGCA